MKTLNKLKKAIMTLLIAMVVALPMMGQATLTWNDNVPPTVADGDIVTIAAGVADTLRVPADATVTIVSDGPVVNGSLRIILSIDSTSKVIWEADYTVGLSASAVGAVGVIGGGLLEVKGSIINTATALNTNAVFLTNGSITVSSGGFVASPLLPATGASNGFARAIDVAAANTNATVTVDGGTVFTAGADRAIRAGGNVAANQMVVVKNGGKVVSAGALAIRADAVTIENGFVLGAPQTMTTPSIVAAAIQGQTTTNAVPPTLNITGNSVIAGWGPRGDRNSQRTFTQNTSTNLHSFHGEAEVWWDIKDEQFGISSDVGNFFIQIPEVTVVVPPPPVAPTITTTTLASGRVGVTYSETLEADGDIPITWSLREGSILPDGLTLSAAGLISGDPIDDGLFTFRVIATNNAGADTVEFSITINPEIPGVATWNTATPPTVGDGTVVTIAVGASGTLVVPADAIVTIISDGPVVNGSNMAGLEIDPTSKVVWEADYSVGVQLSNTGAVRVMGGGLLEVKGRIINTAIADGANAILLTLGDVTVLQSGYVATPNFNTATNDAQGRGIQAPSANANATVIIDGGTVFSTGNHAIRLQGGATTEQSVTVKNEGRVISTANIAILSPTTTIDNSYVIGTIRADGVTPTLNNVVAIPTGASTPTITGNSIIVGWNRGTRAVGIREFTQGTSTNLFSFYPSSPEEIKVWWDIKEGLFGLSADVNNFFAHLTDVTVSEPAVPTAPTITTTTLVTGMVSIAYTETLKADGDTPITWSLREGSTLPDGLTLSAAGVISGDPTDDGLFTFRVIATNDVGADTAELSITIAPAVIGAVIWNTDTPPTVGDGTIVTIAAGAADTLIVPADATVTIISASAVNNAALRVALNIDPTSKVIWEADYTVGLSAAGVGAVTVTGGGLLEITGSIVNTNRGSNTFGVFLANGNLTVSQGGLISCPALREGTSNSFARGVSIPNTNRTAIITVDGGTINVAGADFAIYALPPTSETDTNWTSVIVKNGGRVISTHGRAMRVQSVTVENGLVFGAQQNPTAGQGLAQAIVDVIGSSESASRLPTILNISGNSAIISWDRGGDTDPRSFTQSSNERLGSLFGNAKAWWDTKDEKFGVSTDNGFFVEVPYVTVSPPVAPKITTTTLAEGMVGEAYTQTLEATGTTIIWGLQEGSNLPTGLILSAAGAISGTPTAAGDFTFHVIATNNVGADTAELSIKIAPEPDPIPPTITTKTLVEGTVGTAYTETLEADGDAPITWSLQEGSTLPNGLILSAVGVISGTPTAEGKFTFRVIATNAAGADTAELSMTIAPDPDPDPIPPTITTKTLANGTVGTAYSETLEADGDDVITWSLQTGSTLPAGLTLSEEGTISGTPTTAGAATFRVVATNDVGADTAEFTITIAPSTNIHDIMAVSSVQVWIADDILNIKGLPIGQLYQIYSISGKLVHQSIASSDVVTVNKPLLSGTYIIRSGVQSIKFVW